MSKNRLILHLINHVNQTVRLHIQVWRVDLVDISSEYDLRALASTSDDSLNLVRSKVLCLINDHESIRERTSTDECKRLDDKSFVALHLLKFLYLAACIAEIVLDDIKIVKERLHVWRDLLSSIARECAEVFVGHCNDRTGEHNGLEILVLSESSGKSDESLTRSGLSSKGNKTDIRVHQDVHSERLLSVARLNAESAALVNAADDIVGSAMAGENRCLCTLEEEALISNQIRQVELVGINAVVVFFVIKSINEFGRDIFVSSIIALKYVYVLDLVVEVILCRATQRAGLHAEIDILGYQNGRSLRMFLCHGDCSRENVMVRGTLNESVSHLVAPDILGKHIETTHALAERCALSEKVLIANYFIKFASELTGIEVLLLIALFELVEFLEDYHWEIDVILLKIVDSTAVVKDYISVENKIFLSHKFSFKKCGKITKILVHLHSILTKSFMQYSEAIQLLYNQAPMFSHVGKAGYKEGLENTLFIDKYYHEPHKNYPTIHVAGTNGKGSTSHLIASALQSAGLKVGLYTSPHLVDFSERIRVNGQNIDHDYVAKFIEDAQNLIKEVEPSFFEITTSLAFCYFRDMKVDVAVVEVGLGGRLDCTNVIKPLVSVITNISLEHTDLLGDTVEKIAYQKAGIIKEGVPVVVGERDEKTFPVFMAEAETIKARMTDFWEREVPQSELLGDHQRKNERTAYMALKVVAEKFGVTEEHIRHGFENVCELTGLMGRWQKIGDNPKRICDVGHNAACLTVDTEQLKHEKYKTLRVVFGVVADKNYRAMVEAMPKEAVYYYVKASIPRALDAETLAEVGNGMGRIGKVYGSVENGYNQAVKESQEDDLVLVCGSNFVVSEILALIKK